MNVVDRICTKYPIRYTLMPDPRMRIVNLTFGAGVPGELRRQIRDRMDCLGIYTDNAGISLLFDIDPDSPGVYTLYCPGDIRYHYSETPIGLAFLNYEIVEAVSWTVYIIACQEHWLDGLSDCFLTSRCFSARQQAAALHIKKSIETQWNNYLPPDQVEAVFRELCGFIDDIAGQAPRFSAQPIGEAAFDKFRNRKLESELYDLAMALFGTVDFEQEVRSYIAMVRQSPLYARRLAQAVAHLTEFAYDIPFETVEQLFTELGTLIDEITPTSSALVNEMLSEKARFTLSRAGLKTCFEQVDRFYLEMARERLQREFLTAVRDQTRAQTYGEFSRAKDAIRAHTNALSRFCFLDTPPMNDDGARVLNWKKLANLEERDIFSKDVSWTPQTLHNLQSSIAYAPQIWICSKKLRNMPECDDIAAAHITRPAPILGEHLVWAIWADAKK